MILNKYKKSNSYFCNSAWRKFLNDILRNLYNDDTGLHVISPFGFELSEDKRFLSKNLRRFYCYIGIPKTCGISFNSLEVAQLFAEKLMSALYKIWIDPNEIAILVTQKEFIFRHKKNYKCLPNDKLIDVQARIVDDNILQDYARYVICTIDSILHKKEEPSHFCENKRHRCRTYQLYIMLESIFGYLLPPLNIFEKENLIKLSQLIDNSIQMFYTSSDIYIRANDYELFLFNSLMIPRVNCMYDAIRNYNCMGELIKIQCEAYHTEGNLELLINKNIYEKAINKIKTTYLNFI